MRLSFLSTGGRRPDLLHAVRSCQWAVAGHACGSRGSVIRASASAGLTPTQYRERCGLNRGRRITDKGVEWLEQTGRRWWMG